MAQQEATPLDNVLSDGAVTALAVSFVFASVATIAVGLRFYVRQIKRTGLLLEDWLILAALIGDWSCVVVYVVLGFQGGLGWPEDQLAPPTVALSDKLFSLSGSINWPVANTLIKASILRNFIRIFYTKKFKVLATAVCLVSIGWCLATILVGMLICTPLSETWAMTPNGHCGNATAAFISLGILDVLLDVVVFSLPIPVLYRLQVSKHAKYGLVATFGLGIFTIVAGTMKLVAIIHMRYKIRFDEAQVWRAYWCAIECSVGIIVACAMTFRPLLDSVFNRFQRRVPQSSESSSTRQMTGQSFQTDLTEMKSEKGFSGTLYEVDEI